MPNDAEPRPVARPVKKAPTVSRVPPPGKKFPCPRCGARLDFDPRAGSLACPYCSFQEEIDDRSGEVAERCYFEFRDKLKEAGKIHGIADHSNETKCGGCGATVILDDKIATERCPFCHTHLEGVPHPVEGLIEPESLLPFELDLRAAREAFTKWIEGLWFAPTGLAKVANLGQLTGVYVPYWTYDTMTYTHYDGQRGDDYTVTVSTGKGSRTETRTDWTSVSGEIQHFFDDVLVCGSTSLPDGLITGMEPWDLGALMPFQASFLSGFQTERYAIGLPEGLKEAKALMAPVITQLICDDIGGDHQRIHDQNTKYSAITFKHTLLPVWIAVFRYHETVYQILVNGRTGKISGRRPWSAWKICRPILAVLLVILLVILVKSLIG